MRSAGWVILVVAAIGCDQSSGGGAASGGKDGSGSAVAAAPVKNPGGGFSADLAKKLDSAGSGNDLPERTNNSMNAARGSEATPADSADAAGRSDATSGSADAKSGSADAKSGSADAKSGSADMKSGGADATIAAAGSAAGSVAGNAAGSAAKPADMKAADAKAADTKAADMKPADTKGGGAVASAEPKPADQKSVSTAPKINGSVIISSSSASKAPVTVPPELKAINISLLPNWERDVEAAGTISFAVKIPGKSEFATFVFYYGIEDAKAPVDRDAYKKWLAENKILTSKDDRQKGTAWYLEGVDGQNRPAFRMVVVYGGKKLICYGSLYKDSGLGDLRDHAIIQAKQICETLAL